MAYDFDFSGSYDSLIKTGFVSINKDDIKNRTVGAKDGVNVLFKVIKNEDYPNLKNNFTRITLEAAIFQEGSDIPVVPNVYHYGKLSLKNEKNVYKLRTDKNRKIMRIHYSPNSDYTAITISTTPGSNKNSSFEDMKVLAPRDYDKVLGQLYGDYMVEPDEKGKATHPVELV